MIIYVYILSTFMPYVHPCVILDVAAPLTPLLASLPPNKPTCFTAAVITSSPRQVFWFRHSSVAVPRASRRKPSIGAMRGAEVPMISRRKATLSHHRRIPSTSQFALWKKPMH